VAEEDERKVKHSMKQWIDRVAMNPVLCHDEELRSFIETDFAVSCDTNNKIDIYYIILNLYYFSLSQPPNHGKELVVSSLSFLLTLGMKIKHWFMPNLLHIF
jgi:hypothetical protein